VKESFPVDTYQPRKTGGSIPGKNLDRFRKLP
jgi:hypothetical protein